MSDNDVRYGGLDIAVDGECDPRSLAHLLGAVIPGEDVPVPPDGRVDSDWGAKLVDLKGVARPPEFSGREDHDWYECKFRFSSAMSLLGILPAMRYCADIPYPVDYHAISPDGRQKNTLLYNLLVQLVRGRALAVVRGVDDANGLEVWRQLQLEYEPRRAARYAQMLQGILTPT
eukprot:4496859-Heterocapsa_arctica.AAC.1